MGPAAERFIEYVGSRGPISLDSCVLIYHLEGLQPYADLTTALLVAAGKGEIRCSISTVAVTELLVRPFEIGEEEKVLLVQSFLLETPGLDLVPVSYEIARTAARLRADYKLRTPDALLVATGIVSGAGAFLSNDAGLKRRVGDEIEVVVLDDFTGSNPTRLKPRVRHSLSP